MNKTVFTIILILFSQFSCEQPRGLERPNIIIIYADDLGYGDLSCYGGDIPTPNIDKIGKEGIRFTDFYAEPVCTPSRYALLTGSYPNRSLHQLQNVLFPLDTGYLDTSETTLAQYLKPFDYTTMLIGKWHLGSIGESARPSNHGFDQFNGFKGGCIDYYYHTYGSFGPDWYINGKLNSEEGFATNLITNHVIDFLDQSKANANPFFVFLTYNAPHYGKSDPDSLPDNTIIARKVEYKGYPFANTLQAPAEDISKFSHVKDPIRKVYSAMVSNLDDNVGILLKYLEAEELLENTMIWFISDNGGPIQYGASNGDLRGQKGSLWEGGIRVPAMVLWKSKIKSNQVIDSPLWIGDIVPTLGAIIGFEDVLMNSKIDGKNISKVLFNGEIIKRDIFWKYGRQIALRSGDWKLVNGTELYNLKTDLEETINLATRYPEKVKELQKRCKEIDTMPN